MERNNRRRVNLNKEKELNILTVILIILVGIVTFVVSYKMYTEKLSENDNLFNSKIAEINNSKNEKEHKKINIIDYKDASSSIGKTVKELEKESNKESKNESNKYAINTSQIKNNKNIVKPVNKKIEKKEEKEEKEEKEKINQELNEKKNNNKIKFMKPVPGKIIKNYSKDNLMYSKTLEEWTTHLGIDFACKKTEVVKVVADGKVKSIKNDPRYGLTVIVEHENGLESIYSSLLTAEFIKEGEMLKKGQTIATVGNTARFEKADATHLHFEMKKDGKNINPNDYIG